MDKHSTLSKDFLEIQRDNNDRKEGYRKKNNNLDEMLGSLVDLLEEKGIIDGDEWEEKVKKRLEETRKLKKFEELD